MWGHCHSGPATVEARPHPALLQATVPWTPTSSLAPASQCAPTMGRGSYQAVPVGFCFGNGFLNGFFCHSQGDGQSVHHAVS